MVPLIVSLYRDTWAVSKKRTGKFSCEVLTDKFVTKQPLASRC
jgi:hypothetical protein